MADYKLTQSDGVIRARDSACIPADPANSDWREYQTWLAAGGVPDPYVPPAPASKFVATPRQVRLALNATGMRQAIEDYVASQSQDVRDSWEFSTVFEEDHPLIIAGKAALGISDAQMRALFELAVTL